MDWAQIFIVSLTAFLVIVLVLATVLIVYLAKLTRQIKSISDNAENAVRAVEGSVKAVNKPALFFVAARGLTGKMRGIRKNEDTKPSE